MTDATLWALAGAAVASVVWVWMLAIEVQATQRAQREQRVAEAALEQTRRALANVRRQQLPSDPAEVRQLVDDLTGAEVWDERDGAA